MVIMGRFYQNLANGEFLIDLFAKIPMGSPLQKARPVIVTIVPAGTVSPGENSIVADVSAGFAQAEDKPYDNIAITVKAANPVIRVSACMTLFP